MAVLLFQFSSCSFFWGESTVSPSNCLEKSVSSSTAARSAWPQLFLHFVTGFLSDMTCQNPGLCWNFSSKGKHTMSSTSQWSFSHIRIRFSDHKKKLFAQIIKSPLIQKIACPSSFQTLCLVLTVRFHLSSNWPRTPLEFPLGAYLSAHSHIHLSWLLHIHIRLSNCPDHSIFWMDML